MKAFVFLFVALLSLAPVRGAVATSQDYQLTTIGLDEGGGPSGSANYACDLSVGLVVGRSVQAQTFIVNTLGFAAQLNSPPIAQDDLRTHQFDAALDIVISGLLGNDSDPDYTREILGLHTFQAVTDAGGSVVRNGGLLTYTPPPNFRGTDHFTYTVIDPDADIDTGVVALLSRPAIPFLNNGITWVKLSDGKYLFHYQGPTGGSDYDVQSKTDLNAPEWDNYIVAKAGGDGIVEWIADPRAELRRFFKVTVF
jgi:hypothetical protein